MKYGYVVGPCVAAAAGFAIGALVMYVFDPDNGKRRRTIAREKTGEAMEGVQSAARDLKDRAQSLATEARNTITRNRPDSETIESRLPGL